MMYTITNIITGTVLGSFEASSEAEALELMAQASGYVSYAAMCEQIPAGSGEIEVAPQA
jgi:hypothetical protein